MIGAYFGCKNDTHVGGTSPNRCSSSLSKPMNPINNNSNNKIFKQ